ncbi:putative O-glycosylation ligase, exosortase A system-associated [Roseococcus sp. DSY-14]|uniref:putative O-glycosylation ligase, exosortase A system-associated n=1 Tax=Roseococcus sp. DSY-14 TaxID=3369650 RepID=UPI00387B1D2F
MLRSTFLILFLLAFFAMGAAAPFVMGLGYVWVSITKPQLLAYMILPSVPVAMIFGAATLLLYLTHDRRDPPKPDLLMVLLGLFALWFTASTFLWAVVPEFAVTKWDWALKTILFTMFMPFIFRTRVQIEAFVQVYVIGLLAVFLPMGVKVALSGGGYGQFLGLFIANTGLGEGATLAGVTVMSVPLALWLMRHGQLQPRWPIVRLAYLGVAVMAVLATVGTYQRTGLVGLVVLAAFAWWKTKRKILGAVLIAVGVGIAGWAASDRWEERMSTITNYENEGSAMGRIRVWTWTWNYVLRNPLGGGFESYRINSYEQPHPLRPDEILTVTGKAFHSIYFEVLGEQGFPGLALLLAICAVTLLVQWRLARRFRKSAEHEWIHGLANALQVATVVLMVCGAFIGIGYQPWLYFLVGTTMCLHQHVRRLDAPAKRRPGTPAPAARAAPPREAERRPQRQPEVV